jgi:uncharacterized protein (DUF2236 family)
MTLAMSIMGSRRVLDGMTSYLGWKVDFSRPRGEPAFSHPGSVQWRIYKNPVALAIGGVAAVLMEFADPRIRSGVWDHSSFKVDPVGRSRRTAVAAAVGVYGPRSAARRVIQGVTNMHAKVGGRTPAGEAYRALDPELLDWVAATAAYGFLIAYDRFVGRIGPADKARYFREGAEVARLYGAQTQPRSIDDFLHMAERFAPRFEPHPIVEEFLSVIQSDRAAKRAPRRLRLALARGAVSIVPPVIRRRLALGEAYELTRVDRVTLKLAGALAERWIDPESAPCQACLRLGLPVDFLYRGAAERARLLARAGFGEAAGAQAA